jgi:hypothetical protein
LQEPLKLCRQMEGYRDQWRSSWLLEMLSGSHQQLTIALAGRKSRRAWNLVSEI